MKRHIAIMSSAPIAILLLAGCGSADSGGSSSSQSASAGTSASGGGQTCGVHTVNGVQVRTFCGTGTVTMSDSKSTMTLNTAECGNDTHGFFLNAGTIVLDPSDTKVRSTTQYVGLAIAGKAPVPDGTGKAIIGGNNKGEPFGTNALKSTITLTGGGKAGNGSGPSLNGAGTVKVEFTCS